MAKKPKRTAMAKPPATGARLDIGNALQALLAAYRPHDAAQQIDASIRENRVRLWCNGRLVRPEYYRSQQMFVQVSVEPDGRWAITMDSHRALAAGPFRWEVDRREIEALLLPKQPGRKPGPKPRSDWPTLVAAELVRLMRDEPSALQNVDALVDRLTDFLEREIDWAPKDSKEIRAQIIGVLQRVR